MEPGSTTSSMATQRKLCSPNLPINTKASCYYSIRPPVMPESVAPLHVTTPQDSSQDTPYLASYFPVSPESCLDNATRVYPGAETSGSYVPMIPFPDFNSNQDNIHSMTNNPCQSYGRYANDHQLERCDSIPLSESSSTGSLSMEYGDEPYQWIDTQYYSIPQSILSNVSNTSTTFPGRLHVDSRYH